MERWLQLRMPTCVLVQAGDGLQVGDDKIKPVGNYTVTTFAGSISEVKLKFD